MALPAAINEILESTITMKSLWKTILNGLTYRDLAGHMQLRAHTIISGLILLLLLATGGMAALNRYLLMSRVQAAAEPVLLTAQPTTPPASEPEQGGCPTDAMDWSLTPTYISKTYAVIQPACVYRGLEQTIAWALAIREGYSRAEATRQLGFAEMPMRRLDQVLLPTESREPIAVPVGFIPPNPDFTEWRLNADGEAAVTYALRGCFRTSSVVGNRTETWGGEYAVICMVVEDAENTHIVYALDGHVYTSDAVPMRSFLLFGYAGGGLWVWLGTQENPKQEIVSAQINARERLTVATMYDSQPWDASWLLNTHHLIMQPPPQNWQLMTDESEGRMILNSLTAGLSEARP